MPLVFAFGLAPAIFVAAHFYTLIRYDMLADNLRQFREDLPVMVVPEPDRRRCRQLLANVEFVNAQAMPKGSRGRTARLLMNLILIRGGYPPVAVRPEDRPAYLGALPQAQASKGTEAFDLLLYRRLDATLGEYLSASKEALPQPTQPRQAPKPGSAPQQ